VIFAFIMQQELPLRDDFLAALTVLAATASVVVASVARQENLSGRTRALAREFRDLMDKEIKTEIDKTRIRTLPEQISEFRKRLRHCVNGHSFLYTALLTETIGFGAIFIRKLQGDISLDNWNFRSSALAIAFMLLAAGLILHIWEYLFSHKTINLELADIEEYDKELKRIGLDRFLELHPNPIKPNSHIPANSQTGKEKC